MNQLYEAGDELICEMISEWPVRRHAEWTLGRHGLHRPL